MNPEDIKKQAVNRGRDAIASLRRDFTLRDFNALPPVPGQIPSAPEPVRRVLPQNKPLTPTQFAVSALKPITQPIAKTVDEAFIKPGVVTAQRIGQVISELQPKALSNRAILEKYNLLNPQSVQRTAIESIQKGKDPKIVANDIFKTAFDDLKKYTSNYITGAFTSLDAPNRIVIRPAWDTYKIKLAQDRNQDVDVAGVLQGSKTLSLPDILQIDPNSLDYQAYRFLDFAPELINVPGGGTGKTVSLAKKVKLPQEGLFDEVAQDAAQKFARETGEALSKEVVDRAKEIAPTLQNLEQKAIPMQDLITEARKYKTPEEFINRFNQVKQPVVTNPALLKFKLNEVLNNPVLFQKYPELSNFNIRFSPRNGSILKGASGGIFGRDIIIADSFIEKVGDLKKVQEIEDKLKPFYKIELEGGTLTPEQYKIANDLLNQKADLVDAVGATVKISDDGLKVISHEIQHAKQNLTGIVKSKKDDVIAEVSRSDANLPNSQYWIDKAEIEARSAEDKILTPPKLQSIWEQAQKITQETGKLVPRKEITPAEIAVQGELGGVPPSGNIPLALPGGVPFQTKQRKFPTTVKEAKSTAKGVTKILEDRFDLYSPIKNATEYEKAVKFVNENTVDDVIEGLKYTDDPVSISYVGQALMSKLQKEGNFQRVIDVLDIVAEQGTRSGQAVQALSIWGKLTPEGALKTARSRVAKYNTDNKLTPDMPGYLKLTENQAKRISEQAMKMLKAPEGYDRMKEASNLVAEIAKTTPASIGDKIAAFQTIAQLLNPKTFIRNIGGNLLFGSIDVLSQNFASLIDLATALFTKKRTIAPANLKKLTEGGVEGLQKGLQEALTGADTTNLKSQFDLPNASVFDSRIMQGLEKALGVVLKAPDRAFYEATYKDTLSGLMKLNKTNKPTKEMIEIAHAEGLRRTFQDDTRASKAFQMIKNAFNKAGIKGFGLGDLVLKYPKTPANLLVRATEYSPVGFLTTVYELARPLFGQPFRQREFANNLSRALVGSGIITTGANLYNLGILTSRPNSDKDLRSAQDLQGLKSYSFNISALKRFVMSGFDADAAKPAVGDTLYSYDWAQPISVPLAMGANIAENQNKVKTGSFADKLLLSFGPLGSEIIQSADTLVEQPLLTGLQRLFTSQNPTQGIVDTITSLPASFVPTLFNQINQLTDNVSRETYSPDYFQAAINQTQARIPYLATFLPERKDILGRTRYKYPDNSNTIFNVFINPGFMDTIKENESLKEVISIFEETGEKGQIPRVVQKSIKVNGEDRLLSGPEISNYQQELGQLSDNVIRSSLLSENYLKLSPTDRSKLIATMITDANKVAKIRLFGETADDISQTQELLLNGDINRYVDDRVAKKEEALIRQKFRQSGIKISGIKSPVAKKPRIRKAPKVKKARIPKIKKRKPIKISGIRLKRRKPRNI